MAYHEVFVNVFLAVWQSLFPATVEPLTYNTFAPPPDSITVGLVRDEVPKRWWVSDRKSNQISYRTDSADTWIAVFPGNTPLSVSGELGPIAMNGKKKTLWVVVEQAETAFILTLDTSETSLRELRPPIEIPPAARRRNPSVTGLTWDGDHLWMVTRCGLCSTLFKIDPDNGEEKLSFFPACSPRGIAFRPAGPFVRGQLWIIAYNGPKKRPLLSRRKVPWIPAAQGTSQDFYRFKNEEGKGPPFDPTAIAARGDFFWVVDRRSDTVIRYSPGVAP